MPSLRVTVRVQNYCGAQLFQPAVLPATREETGRKTLIFRLIGKL